MPKKEVSGEVCFIDDTNDWVFMSEAVAQKKTRSVNGLRKKKPDDIIQHGNDLYIEQERGTVDKLGSLERKLAHPDPK